MPSVNMHSVNNLTAILLLGGKSSRMGVRKDNLIWSCQPLWQYLFNLLVSLVGTPSNVYISGRKAHPNAILDLVPNQGPLMGLYSVLEMLKFSEKLHFNSADNSFDDPSLALNPQLILVLPVDLPLIEMADLRILTEFNGEACIFGDSPLPVCFKFTKNFFQILQEIVLSSTEPHSFYYLLKHLQVEQKPVRKNQLMRLRGANTPKEWEEAIYEFKNQ